MCSKKLSRKQYICTTLLWTFKTKWVTPLTFGAYVAQASTSHNPCDVSLVWIGVNGG